VLPGTHTYKPSEIEHRGTTERLKNISPTYNRENYPEDYSGYRETEITQPKYSGYRETEITQPRYSGYRETEINQPRYSGYRETSLRPEYTGNIIETESSQRHHGISGHTKDILPGTHTYTPSEIEHRGTTERLKNISPTYNRENYPEDYSGYRETEIDPKYSQYPVTETTRTGGHHGLSGHVKDILPGTHTYTPSEIEHRGITERLKNISPTYHKKNYPEDFPSTQTKVLPTVVDTGTVYRNISQVNPEILPSSGTQTYRSEYFQPTTSYRNIEPLTYQPEREDYDYERNLTYTQPSTSSNQQQQTVYRAEPTEQRTFQTMPQQKKIQGTGQFKNEKVTVKRDQFHYTTSSNCEVCSGRGTVKDNELCSSCLQKSGICPDCHNTGIRLKGNANCNCTYTKNQQQSQILQ
jgi:predicted GNAT family acetyltransferase